MSSAKARLWKEGIKGSRPYEGASCQRKSHRGLSEGWHWRLAKDKPSIEYLFIDKSYVLELSCNWAIVGSI
jgi:hypothetical protein